MGTQERHRGKQRRLSRWQRTEARPCAAAAAAAKTHRLRRLHLLLELFKFLLLLLLARRGFPDLGAQRKRVGKRHRRARCRRRWCCRAGQRLPRSPWRPWCGRQRSPREWPGLVPWPWRCRLWRRRTLGWEVWACACVCEGEQASGRRRKEHGYAAQDACLGSMGEGRRTGGEAGIGGRRL